MSPLLSAYSPLTRSDLRYSPRSFATDDYVPISFLQERRLVAGEGGTQEQRDKRLAQVHSELAAIEADAAPAQCVHLPLLIIAYRLGPHRFSSALASARKNSRLPRAPSQAAGACALP